MKKRQKKKVDKRRGNGKVKQFPGQQQEKVHIDPAQEAQMKRIQVAAENILAAMSGLTMMEATGALKTVESMMQKRVSDFLQTEILEAPKNAENPAPSDV